MTGNIEGVDPATAIYPVEKAPVEELYGFSAGVGHAGGGFISGRDPTKLPWESVTSSHQ